MESVPTITVVIDKVTGEELLNEEDMSLSLPEHDEIEALKGTAITIADKEYTVVEAATEPRFNSACDMTGVYVFLFVEKKVQN